MHTRLFFILVCGLSFLARATRAQNVPDFERPPVNYSATEPHDAISRLQARVTDGEFKLAGDDRTVVRALLRELHVPVESQVVVFSKTSLQRRLIGPDHPRALYFSDSIYVGWVPDGLVEIVAIDPQLGPVFYSFDPRAAAGNARTFERNADCLRCHGGTFVRDIPGLLARSIVPDATGEPLLRHGTELVDDETPFERRWGGWYVTGYTGRANHRGNALASERGDELVFPLSDERPTELAGRFDTSRYLAATSDVVALLVLEHQMAMQNALTRAGQSCRRMLDYQHSLQKTFREPETDEPAYDSVKSVFAGAIDDVVDRLLFRGAAPLPAGVTGAAFPKAFGRDAPRSRAGRALKDLQLHERLFANRCSFLIYSESFAALPAPLKAGVLDRLAAVLRDDVDPRGRYAYLERDEKRRIFEILRETQVDAKIRWATPPQ